MVGAFKANTNDSRESAAIKVSENLYKAGAEIYIYDPKISKENIEQDIIKNWKTDIQKSKLQLTILPTIF